jgi:broad specificity phosphatase PhoE
MSTTLRLHLIRHGETEWSPRQRARRTCELAGLGTTAVIEPGLAEWDYGEYEGRRSADICRERPGWMVFRDGCPGGEMPEQVANRADRIIARLSAMQGNVAIFSHGQFGCVLATRWIGLPIIEARHFSLRPASLSTLSYDADHIEVPVIALWNAVPT